MGDGGSRVRGTTELSAHVAQHYCCCYCCCYRRRRRHRRRQRPLLFTAVSVVSAAAQRSPMRCAGSCGRWASRPPEFLPISSSSRSNSIALPAAAAVYPAVEDREWVVAIGVRLPCWCIDRSGSRSSNSSSSSSPSPARQGEVVLVLVIFLRLEIAMTLGVDAAPVVAVAGATAAAAPQLLVAHYQPNP